MQIEILALRHQLAVLQRRTTKRPSFKPFEASTTEGCGVNEGDHPGTLNSWLHSAAARIEFLGNDNKRHFLREHSSTEGLLENGSPTINAHLWWCNFVSWPVAMIGRPATELRVATSAARQHSTPNMTARTRAADAAPHNNAQRDDS